MINKCFRMSKEEFSRLVFGGKYNVYSILLSMFTPNSKRKEYQNDTINDRNDKTAFRYRQKHNGIYEQGNSNNPHDIVVYKTAKPNNRFYYIFQQFAYLLKRAFLSSHVLTPIIKGKGIINGHATKSKQNPNSHGPLVMLITNLRLFRRQRATFARGV